MNPGDTSEQTPRRPITKDHKVVPHMHNDFLMRLCRSRTNIALLVLLLSAHRIEYSLAIGEMTHKLLHFQLSGAYCKSLAQHLLY